MAVVERDGEGLNLGLARRQVFHRSGRHAVVPGDHTTQPGAGRVGADRGCQRAQRCRRGRCHADAVRVGQVHVGEGDRAAVGEVARGRDQFGHPAGHIGGGHQRCIVGAGDLHHKCLTVGATVLVVRCQRVGQGDDFAGGQIVERGVGRREGHRYAAGGGARYFGDGADADQRLERRCIQCESGSHATGSHIGDSGCVANVGQIYIAKAGGDAAAQRAGCGLFAQIRLADGCNCRCIIGAGDGHRQAAGGSAAPTIVNGVGEGIGQVLANRQSLHRRLGVVCRVAVAAVGTDGQRAVVADGVGGVAAAG